MAVFSAGELYAIAVGIEKNGVAYYSALSESVDNPQLKKTYLDLAEMERGHIRVFEDLRAALVHSGPVVTPDVEEEYDAYLKALIGSAVFSDDKVARELALRVSGTAEALQLAIGAEKDSILFYTEMKGLVPAREREAVERIIREEKTHLRDLSALKQKYA
jgi:rubrerythrin